MRNECKSARLPLLICVLGIVHVSSGPVFAARHVPIAISVNGKVVMKAGTGDNGSPDADTVWGYLKDAQLQPIKGFSVEPDREEPLKATLKGDCIIDVTYAGRAEVSELKLVRPNEDSPWQVAPAEVERTFKIRHKPFAFGISINNKPTYWTVLRTRTGKTADNPDNVWRELKQQTIYGRKIAANQDDPLRATLTGSVVIKLSYAGQSWGRAEVSDLKLHRDRANALWKLEPAEVERTLKVREKPE
jgi:hypothetical protein